MSEIEKLREENEQLRFQVAELLGATPGDVDETDVRVLKLTPTQRTLYLMLRKNTGKCVSREGLMVAIYGGSPDDEPEMKIIDVFVCKLREKMRRFGSPYAIETVWGVGYRMVNTKP